MGLELALAVFRQGGIFMLEHPAPLSKHTDVDAPSIWAQPKVLAIEGLDGVARVDMQQGCFGAKSQAHVVDDRACTIILSIACGF